MKKHIKQKKIVFGLIFTILSFFIIPNISFAETGVSINVEKYKELTRYKETRIFYEISSEFNVYVYDPMQTHKATCLNSTIRNFWRSNIIQLRNYGVLDTNGETFSINLPTLLNCDVGVLNSYTTPKHTLVMIPENTRRRFYVDVPSKDFEKVKQMRITYIHESKLLEYLSDIEIDAYSFSTTNNVNRVTIDNLSDGFGKYSNYILFDLSNMTNNKTRQPNYELISQKH